MSNPAVAPRQQSEPIDLEKSLPDCHYGFMYADPAPGETMNEWRKESKTLTSLDGLVKQLSKLDMRVEEPFTIPKELTLDDAGRKSAKPFRATAKKGAMVPRKRTKIAKDALETAYVLLPPGIKEEVAQRSRELSMVDAGAEFTIGRFVAAYPKVGSKIQAPITRAEAEWGWETEVGSHLGSRPAALELREQGKLNLLPMWAPEGMLAVKTNRNATTGFPVLANAREAEVMALVQELTVEIDAELQAAYTADPDKGVEAWLRKAEKERPFLVALQGKAKADFYKEAKAKLRMLRFYNSMPRHMTLVIQRASQVLERESRSINDDNRCHSASGTAMNHGGMKKLVRSLDEQCRREEEGHSRMGDDSMCAIVVTELEVREGVDTWVTYVLMFALDCSNFDLTQHGKLTKHVHGVLLEILGVIDQVSAQLLHAYQRERLVVLMLTLAYTLLHGGPSGLPLQSKVNGVIMGVAIKRLYVALRALVDAGTGLTEEVVSAAIKKVGDAMGLVVRLEQYAKVELSTTYQQENPVTYALTQTKFLYLGYHFYNEEGIVCGHADMARTMAQMRYPSLLWVTQREELHGLEIGRLAATFLSWGRPTRDLRPAFDAIRAFLLDQLDKKLSQGGNVENPKLVWNTQASALMAPEELPDGTEDTDAKASLAGLYRTLAKSYDQLWLGDDAEETLSSASETSETDVSLSPPPPAAGSLRLQQYSKTVPSRGPTKKTAGRNPNTKVFQPALPPRNPMARLHENAGWQRGRGEQISFGDFDSPDEEYAGAQEEEAVETARRAQEAADEALDRAEADRERARQAATEARLERAGELSDDDQDYFGDPRGGIRVDQDEGEYLQGLQQAAYFAKTHNSPARL